jgi:sarcosine oxidase subunit beta
LKADVVVIGGGAIGWSTAWHLLQRKPSLDVLVVDPDSSRCTSLRGAGGCRAQFASEVNIALSLLSIEKLKRFRSEVGEEIGFRQNGYLLFTADAARAEAMRELARFQRSCGVLVEEWSVAELASRVPMLFVDDLLYAQIGLQDGYFDGPSVQIGYRKAARRMGARELSGSALEFAAGRVSTSEGEVSCGAVVVATGHWSGMFDFPVVPEKHQLYFCSVAVDPSLPFVIDADTTYHFRPDGDRILTCFNDPELSTGEHDADEFPEFEDSVLERLLPIAEHRTPGFLSRDNCKFGRAGFYGVTEDRHPLIGLREGVVVCLGFCGHGVMHSPAAGQLAAELVLDGRASSVDVSALDPGRFERGELVRETMVF